eukprot:6175766-Pleurochrysis_carterae.AAC.2
MRAATGDMYPDTRRTKWGCPLSQTARRAQLHLHSSQAEADAGSVLTHDYQTKTTSSYVIHELEDVDADVRCGVGLLQVRSQMHPASRHLDLDC